MMTNVGKLEENQKITREMETMIETKNAKKIRIGYVFVNIYPS